MTHIGIDKEAARKAEIATMPRKELNGHAYLCEKEQEEYEVEIADIKQQLAQAHQLWGECEAQNQQLREELKKLEHRNTVLTLTNETLNRYEREGKEELEQVKKERDNSFAAYEKRLDKYESLRSELSAMKSYVDQLERDNANAEMNLSSITNTIRKGYGAGRGSGDSKARRS